MRFPEFSGEWKKCKLGDLCNVLMCKRILVSQTNTEDGVPFYKIGTIGSTPDAYISKELFDDYKVKYNYPRKGEVMITCAGTVGKCVVYDGEDAYFQDSNIVWIDNPTQYISNGFLFHLLSKVDWRKLNSTTIIRIYNDDLRNLKMSYPRKEEQQKISHLLSLLDERIATQNKIIEDLKKLKSAIIEKTFNENYSNKIRLRDVGSYIRGLTYSSDDVVESNGIFVMRSNNIINGSSLDYHNNIVSVNKQILTEQQLQTGDIVICMANGSSSLVGKSSFYDGDCSTPITVGAFCGIYRSKEPIVKWLFQTNKYRRYIWNSLQGGNGAIANLNGDDILRMSFSIPATPAKDNRIKLLTSVDTLLESNISLCDLYISQKLYLLRQMFI
ncbi:restriction endonuclease subunit S [Bacteroides thetaiotaomicron]|uniref:restriction endonuclease subunit S n=1 Tax=Bacteroides thetaiotaomicron TaxID=818 RepID=UPI002165369D|nr:restriction endonuclease subunit S [Bacteroides thetaiotaomicron]MCS2599405.1 restriction endonuclease subunit S [Bacteroides thetaiotaomicron]